MQTRTVEIPTPDGVADAFVAFPDHHKRYPGILLFVDAIGLRPVIMEMAKQLAGEGYYVLVPNIFYRHGRAPVIDVPDLSNAEARETFFQQLAPVMEALTTERALNDAGAYLAHLTAQREVDGGSVGMVGYCMGGVLAFRAAAEYPNEVTAVACFHPGPLVTEAADSLHLLASRLKAELYFGLAEQDDCMPPAAIAQLQQSLDDAKVSYASEVIQGTVHGFTMSDTAAFNPDGLKRHWERLIPFFDRALSNAV